MKSFISSLRSAHYKRKADKLERKAMQLHAEMFQMMTPYITQIDKLEKQAWIARKMAAVTSIDSLRDVIAKGESEAFNATLV